MSRFANLIIYTIKKITQNLSAFRFLHEYEVDVDFYHGFVAHTQSMTDRYADHPLLTFLLLLTAMQARIIV